MRLLLQLMANGVVTGALYAMLAIGFGIVWRSLRVFHAAYGGLYVFSAYIFYGLVVWARIPLLGAALLTWIVAAALGWLIEVGFYRQFFLRSASSGAVLIASLSALLVMENLVALVFGNEFQTVARGLARSIAFGPVALTPVQLIQLGVGIFVVALLWLLVRHLRLFKAMWAMGDQPDLIAVLGLPVFRLRSLVMITSTILVGIVASLVCLDTGTSPQVGINYVLIATVCVLLGGMNSYAGWVVGAVVLAMLQSLIVWQVSSRWMDLVTFSLLVLILVFRPRGLLAREGRPEERI